MSNAKFESLEPEFKEKIGALCAELGALGIICVVTSGRRTIAEQNQLYAQGRSEPGKIVTNARGGSSPHNFGLAADLCPLDPKTKELWWTAPDEIWRVIAVKAQSMGLVAGYFFHSIVDKPHVEDPTWHDVRAEWMNGKIKVA